MIPLTFYDHIIPVRCPQSVCVKGTSHLEIAEERHRKAVLADCIPTDLIHVDKDSLAQQRRNATEANFKYYSKSMMGSHQPQHLIMLLSDVKIYKTAPESELEQFT